MSLDLVWLVPALPLLGFVVLVVIGRRLGEPLAGWLATLMPAGSFLVVVGLYLETLSRNGDDRIHTFTLFEWIPVGGLNVGLGFLVDPLSITMALFVTGIGTLIHLYAIGYMHGDPNFSKFFIYLNLFVFSMLMLVLGDNLLVTFLGWEGVGTCSYFLISFWHTRNSAAVAGKKAFVTNRIGDWGFMLAMFLVWASLGSLDYLVLKEQAGTLSESTALGIALLLFVGAIGKSAQLPLYVWLPDAMEGPTPVSALIHAATMVTAGVFLMTRAAPVLVEADTALTIIAWTGALTALFAATVAVAQNDIKKVLAYSTVSQLGYMFLAVGSGAYVAAVFHMITHAFFKALMFLGSGSVIHGMHDEQDMRRMGALRKAMPVTAVTFIIGWLAIAGVPPFAGFWSKDEILLYVYGKSPILWAIGLLTALLTAYYMTRQVIMVFFGKPRWDGAEPHHGDETEPVPMSVGAAGNPAAREADHEHGHGSGFKPHESPWTMLVPLVVLAGLSIVGGGLNLPWSKDLHFLGNWLEPVVGDFKADTPDVSKLLMALFATVAALLGLLLAYLVYAKKKAKAVEPAVLANAWYVDRTYASIIGGPGRKLFDIITFTVDKGGVDGAVNGVGTIIRSAGGQLRRLQTGFVRNYAVAVAGGAALLLLWFVSRGMG